ncbi:MAG: tripartite tricarboxylate transporter substrate binding protein [Burkholderiaceae bacterium]|nr:tripartite tricarboxylate transporter substrate binding protein [Burkholderiaceae bacterium]
MRHRLVSISRVRAGLAAAAALFGFSMTAPAMAAWEPTKPVEFVVPAGTGGGADQMARFIQGVVTKHALMKQPIVVVNKSGGAGAEGFLEIKGAKGDAHKLVITLSNLFTTPLGTGVPVNWKDLTPVAMLALDQFVLWVNAESPYKTGKDYLDAIKAAPNNTFKMAGTGSKQEDQIITVALEKAAGRKMTYIPFKGGGDVAVQLVGKHVDSTVNNPIEAIAHWRGGKLRPLCVLDDERMPYKAKITETMSWNDIPSCRESGVPVDYVMMRGIFMPPGVSAEQVDWYIDLFKRVRATPDWKEFMEKGAFKDSFMTGKEYTDWVAKAEELHRTLMRDAGFLAK